MHADPVGNVLRRLEGVSQSSPNQWYAQCPAHDDQRPSLSVGRAKDGKVLLYCHAGCSIERILKALNMEMSDLFPRRQGGGR